MGQIKFWCEPQGGNLFTFYVERDGERAFATWSEAQAKAFDDGREKQLVKRLDGVTSKT